MKTEVDLASLFVKKLKCDLIKVDRITGGRNSQIFRIEDSQGKKFAAKIYHTHKADPRDRLKTEFNALNFLWDNNIKNIPKPIAAEPANGFAVYEYIDGCTPLLSSISLHDIDEACKFLVQINQLKTHADAVNIPSASEAVFSINELNENLKQRYGRLMALPRNDKAVVECQDFLRQQVYPFYTHLLNRSKHKLSTAGIKFDTILPETARILSPSDFGFHNSLRRPDGKLVFLDFEYFGWDDPAKTIADFILHPGMKLELELKQRFADNMIKIFDNMDNLNIRLSAFLPLFGLKWCFILLNEFIPSDMARRDFSFLSSDEPEKRKIRQLNKAKKMLKEVIANYEQSFYFN